MTTSTTPYIDLARVILAGYEPKRLDGAGTRPAAVLLLLYHDRGEDRIVLTRRTDTVEHHKGQISFPGGGVDPDDPDPAFTALRETWEEVGIAPESVELLGRLDDMITISDFLVAPFVGVLHQPPPSFTVSEHEVAEVLEVSVRHLLEDGSLVMERREVRGGTVLTPAYLWEGHRIWGATARMLHGFLDLLRVAAEPAVIQAHHSAGQEGTR